MRRAWYVNEISHYVHGLSVKRGEILGGVCYASLYGCIPYNNIVVVSWNVQLTCELYVLYTVICKRCIFIKLCAWNLSRCRMCNLFASRYWIYCVLTKLLHVVINAWFAFNAYNIAYLQILSPFTALVNENCAAGILDKEWLCIHCNYCSACLIKSCFSCNNTCNICFDSWGGIRSIGINGSVGINRSVGRGCLIYVCGKNVDISHAAARYAGNVSYNFYILSCISRKIVDRIAISTHYSCSVYLDIDIRSGNSKNTAKLHIINSRYTVISIAFKIGNCEHLGWRLLQSRCASCHLISRIYRELLKSRVYTAFTLNGHYISNLNIRYPWWTAIHKNSSAFVLN